MADTQGNKFSSVSGGDAPGANPLIPFFGYPLNADQLINPAYNLPHEAIGLSDGQDFANLYKGPSPFMSITLQALIVEADEWPTRVLMPWYHTDKVNIGWQIWKFDRTLADLEPEQGVPRYITTEYEHKSSRMLRRGLAFQLEHGFWSTEEGKLNYAMNIQTIRSAVHETVYQSILHSLLNEGQALTKFYNARYNVANFTLKTALEFEKWRFGIVNKQQHGLELIDAELSKYLSREAVKPDVWVFPPKMKLYCSYATPAALEVFRSGEQRVVENRKASQQILSDSYFAGKQVFESREYAVDFSASPIDQLSRERQTGDYFLYRNGAETLVYDADYDDFMPVDGEAVTSRQKNGTSRRTLEDAERRMGLLASGSKLTSRQRKNMAPKPEVKAPAPVLSDRERMAAGGYSSQQIDQVLNCARCFQLAHLMHSSAAGFAADLQATPTETLARANIVDTNSMNMSINSDSCVVDAIEGRGDVSPTMRVACSLASGIVAGVPHSMLGLRYANIRGSEWYKNLHAAYETAKQMEVGNNGHASEATLRHAVFNGVDTDFVNWVAANVDGDNQLTQIALSSSNAAGAQAANADAAPLAWGALDALSSNLNVDGLSPVAVASLRNASTTVDGLSMSGDAQSVASTLAAVKRHWDAKLSDDYVSSNDAFLGVRRAQAKNASFGHFLANHVFSKDDAAARLAAGSHADAAVASNLNAVSAEGASVWNKLVSTVSQQQGWPASASVPQSLNAWKMASASASLSSASGSSSVSVPLAFRASEVMDVDTQVQNIASSSAKPVTMNKDDAWAAVSFPFAGAAKALESGGPTGDDMSKNVQLLNQITRVVTDSRSRKNLKLLAEGFDLSALEEYKASGDLFGAGADFGASAARLKKIVDGKVNTYPAPYLTFEGESENLYLKLFFARASNYFKKMGVTGNLQKFLQDILNADDSANKPAKMKAAIQAMFEKFPNTEADNDTIRGQAKAGFAATWFAVLSLEPISVDTDNIGAIRAAIAVQKIPEEAIKPLMNALSMQDSLAPQPIRGMTGRVVDAVTTSIEAVGSIPGVGTGIRGVGTGIRAVGSGLGAVSTAVGITGAIRRVRGSAAASGDDDDDDDDSEIDIEEDDVTAFLYSRGGEAYDRSEPEGGWFLIERPFKTFRMGTGILAKGGETLGLTFYGHCNFQWSNNTTNKVHEGHFTFYSRPVVRDWRQYAIAEDIFVLGYVRGEVSGCKKEHFIDSRVLEGANPSTLHEIYGGEHGHLIVYRLRSNNPVSLADVRRTIANPHSITGDWGAFERQYEGSPAKPLGVTGDKHWDSAGFYQALYRNFFDHLKAENSRISGGGFAVAPGTYNTVVWETNYIVKNQTDFDFEDKEPQVVEASDCLPHYYRGRAQAISGMSVFLQPPATQRNQIRF